MSSEAVKLSTKEKNSLMSRFTQAENDNLLWRTEWEAAYSIAEPSLNTTQSPDDVTPGEDLTSHIFDLSLARDSQFLVSKLYNGLTPIFQKWISLVSGDALKMNGATSGEQINAIDKELEDLRNRMFTFINASNFYDAIGDAYFNFIIGTMILKVSYNKLNRNKPFKFKSINPLDVFLERSHDDNKPNVWRKLNDVKKSEILSIWPEAKVNASLRSLTDKETVTLVEGTILQRDGRYMFLLMNPDDKFVLISEIHTRSEYLVVRYSKRRDEVNGRGPVLMAMHSGLSLNEMVKLELMAGQFAVAPPFIGFDEAFNSDTFRLAPGTFIPVSATPTGDLPIKQLEFKSDVQFSEIVINDLREQISKIMLVSPLGPVNAPKSTATEISARVQESVEQFAPIVGRFIVEFQQNLVEILLDIMFEEGLFEFKATKGLTLTNNKIKIDYQAPLAQNQNVAELNAFMRGVQILQSIFGPQMSLGVMDIPEVPDFIAKKLSLPPGIFADPQKIEELTQKVLSQNAAQQAQQTPQGQAEAATARGVSQGQAGPPQINPTGTGAPTI